jgi:hypothetical protein
MPENAVTNKNLINILSWKSERRSSVISKTLASSSYNSTNIFIIPKCGFENEEIEFAKSMEIHTISLVSLGENI